MKTESGRIVTHGEVMGALLSRAEIEVAVVDGKRPEWVACEVCRVPVKVPEKNKFSLKCRVCNGLECPECGAQRKTATGKRNPCRGCSKAAGKFSEAQRNRQAALSAEERSRVARDQWAKIDEETRVRRHQKIRAPETRAKIGGKISIKWAKKTDEEKREIAAKREAAKVKSGAMNKAWATRRAKKAAESAQL